MAHISLINISEVVRQEISNDSKHGRYFNEFVKKGELIPDSLINDIVKERLQNSNESIILDGYPRNVEQAEYLDNEFSFSWNIKAVNIVLNTEIAVEKLLNRMVCKTCKSGFNSANYVNDGYDMPALLPDPSKCVLGVSNCNPVMEKREDDDRDVIVRRFNEYDLKTSPLIDYYKSRGNLINFQVKRGVKDIDDLMHAINSF